MADPLQHGDSLRTGRHAGVNVLDNSRRACSLGTFFRDVSL